MRELKFRAWLKNYNCYAEVLGFDEGKLIVHLQRGELVQHRLHVPIEDCILEQCTGLKDKNGKEIYEGDIVKFKSGVLEQAVYHERYFGMLPSGGGEPYCVPQPYYDTFEAEVIGNIHENNELLEGEK